tara:strand:+ start:428 stop:745 length:318 start_codon:yes stop_codon:yes gene_type:complete
LAKYLSFTFLLTIKVSNLTLAASHAKSRIADLVVGDLSALLQYLGKVPLHAALGHLLDAYRLADPNVHTKHRRIHDRVRCAGNNDLHARANLSGHTVQLMEEPFL